MAALSLTFGVAGWLGVDELLATMTAGAVVANYSQRQETVFRPRERYAEELALLTAQRPALAEISRIVISVIIDATVIHELIGPLVSRMAIRAAGEIPEGGPAAGSAT